MSNNKHIEKPLELPHQETIVGFNTLQTKPFDNQKIENMSNKQTAVEYLFQELWDTPKDKLNWYSILEKAKQMEKEQIEKLQKELVDANDIIKNLEWVIDSLSKMDMFFQDNIYHKLTDELKDLYDREWDKQYDIYHQNK